jgi:hypothetical protein
MRGIAVHDFRDMADTMAVDQGDAAREPRPRRVDGGRSVGRRPRFAKGGKRPRPGGTVVVGWLAPRVFIAGVGSPVRILRIVEQAALMMNRQGCPHRSVGQAADGPRHQQRLAGRKDGAADGMVCHRPKGDGQQLVGAQGIVGYRLGGAFPGAAVKTVNQIAQLRRPEQGGQIVSDPTCQRVPSGPVACINCCKECQGGPP